MSEEENINYMLDNIISASKQELTATAIMYIKQPIILYILDKNRKIKQLKNNSISKDKIKEVLQKNRNELFSTTYVNELQYEPFQKQIDRINKIEKELLKE